MMLESHSSRGLGQSRRRERPEGGGSADYTKARDDHRRSRSSFKLTEDENDGFYKLSTAEKFTYAAPGFATTSLSFLVAVYANDFYVSMGAGLPFIAFFTAMARSFDVMTDPLMGWFSDRTRTQIGRRRPFMMIGPAFYAVFFTLLFYPPPFWPNSPIKVDEFNRNDPESGGFFHGVNMDPDQEMESSDNSVAAYWFGAFYILFYLSDTFTNVPYEALGPELSTSQTERASLFFYAKLFNFFGMLMAAGMPAGLAYGLRLLSLVTVELPCSYLFNPNAVGDVDIHHGSLNLDQLRYIDQQPLPNGTAVEVTKSSMRCLSSDGSFCFQQLYANGSHLYFEVESNILESTCSDANDSTLVELDRYEQSSQWATQLAYVIVAAGFGIYYVVTMVILAVSIRERVDSQDQRDVPLVASVLRAFSNRAFRPLLAAWTLDGLGLSSLVTMFPFFIRYEVMPNGPKAQEGCCAMSAQVCMAWSVFGLLVTAMLSSPLWLLLAKKVGKYRAWLWYNAANALTNILFIIPSEGDPFFTIMCAVANGVPVGGQFLINAVTSDVIDYDEFLYGVRSEGAYSVFATLIPKFVAIPASAIPLAIINMLGFEPPINGIAVQQEEHVKNFIRYTFVLLPFACAVIAFLVKLRYPLRTKEQVECVTQGIQLHRKGLPAVDPITGKTVSLKPKLTDNQELMYSTFESFGCSTLRKYIELYNEESDRHAVDSGEKGGGLERSDTPAASWLCAYQRRVTAFYTALFLSCTVVVFMTFQQLNNRKTSIIPISAVIGCGFLMCLLAISMIRMQEAGSLKQMYWLPDHLKCARLVLEQKLIVLDKEVPLTQSCSLPSRRRFTSWFSGGEARIHPSQSSVNEDQESSVQGQRGRGQRAAADTSGARLAAADGRQAGSGHDGDGAVKPWRSAGSNEAGAGARAGGGGGGGAGGGGGGCKEALPPINAKQSPAALPDLAGLPKLPALRQ